MLDLEEQNSKDPHHPQQVERYWKFVYLVTGIVFFFGCHNYMQELIMHLPGFKVSHPPISYSHLTSNPLSPLPSCRLEWCWGIWKYWA